MATIKMTKPQIDGAVRAEGLALINSENLTAVGSSLFIGETEVNGETRFFEIKVTAKKNDFTQIDLDLLVAEREEVEARKKAVAEASAKKKISDSKRRAKAKEKIELEKKAKLETEKEIETETEEELADIESEPEITE